MKISYTPEEVAQLLADNNHDAVATVHGAVAAIVNPLVAELNRVHQERQAAIADSDFARQQHHARESESHALQFALAPLQAQVAAHEEVVQELHRRHLGEAAAHGATKAAHAKAVEIYSDLRNDHDELVDVVQDLRDEVARLTRELEQA